MSTQQERFSESYAQEEKLDVVLRLEFQRRVISSLTLLLQLSNGEKRLKELAEKVEETKHSIARIDKICIGMLFATSLFAAFFEVTYFSLFLPLAAVAFFIAMGASLKTQNSQNWALFNESMYNQEKLILELKKYTLYSFKLKEDYKNNEILSIAELEIREDVLKKLKHLN
jgi:hypothetical protein